MIKLQVIGHLGRDCVLREVNGKNVINFSVAHSEKFKTSTGMQQERTTWVDCSYWTDRTGIAPYLLKGQLVYVEGSPEAEAFKRQDGEIAAALRLRVRDVQLLGGRTTESGPMSSPSASDTTAQPQQQSQEQAEQPADDLPF